MGGDVAVWDLPCDLALRLRGLRGLGGSAGSSLPNGDCRNSIETWYPRNFTKRATLQGLMPFVSHPILEEKEATWTNNKLWFGAEIVV